VKDPGYFNCEFDADIDDYPDHYTVYRLDAGAKASWPILGSG
jgi:hypothetical protein